MFRSTTSGPLGRSNRKRLLASGITLTAAALVVGTLPSGATAAEPDQGLIASYDFAQTSGSTVPNSAQGDAGPAEVVGGSHWTGDSLELTGGAKTDQSANWVRLPDDLLAGAGSATVTIETKLDASMRSDYNFLWSIGSDSPEQSWFASTRDAPRSAITTSGSGGESNARASDPLAADRWYSLTSVIDAEAGTLSFYVDGQRVGETDTALTPGDIADQSMNTIGRSPYPDPLYAGEVATFRVYDRALDADEVAAVSETDAALHADELLAAAQSVAEGVGDVTFTEAVRQLPDYDGAVAWSSSDSAITVAGDGRTATAAQPEAGEEPVEATLTATATVRGHAVSREVPVTIRPAVGADTPFGYMMVHFIEDSDGYAEKIYLDVSRGDDPEQWDPLNGGEPILASDLGTTGVRDPYLTYSPETETYYIIATDLRVFGGDSGTSACGDWCHWSSNGSTKLNVWESKDLVTWSDLRQFDVATTADGVTHAELGMAWAPEATWVPDYHGAGDGAFVVYWSSNLYDDAEHTGSTYSRVMWGATTDFTQETYEFGGTLVDQGADAIDTTIIQNEGTTYRITKDNGLGNGIYMESTTAGDWWADGTHWSLLQTEIGASWAGDDPGGVEGPAVFKRHDDDHWYLYVDVIPTTGYRPMQTNDLDAGWTELHSDEFWMAPSTKHGGVVSLTKGQYDHVRTSDAVEAPQTDLGSVEIASSAPDEDVRAALPATAGVTLAYGYGGAELPVDWDLSQLDTSAPGTHEVTGTVRSIGANLNDWVGEGGATEWDAPNRELFSTTALKVTAEVVVTAAPASLRATATTRCVAGSVVLVASVTNDGDEAVDAEVSTPYGEREVAVAAGETQSSAFSARNGSIPAGEATATAGDAAVTAPYDAAECS